MFASSRPLCHAHVGKGCHSAPLIRGSLHVTRFACLPRWKRKNVKNCQAHQKSNAYQSLLKVIECLLKCFCFFFVPQRNPRTSMKWIILHPKSIWFHWKMEIADFIFFKMWFRGMIGSFVTSRAQIWSMIAVWLMWLAGEVYLDSSCHGDPKPDF